MVDPWAEFPSVPQKDPWAEFPIAPSASTADVAPAAAKPAAPNAWSDVPLSLGSGAVRGAVELGMLPVTVERFAKQGVGYGVEKADSLVRSIFGAAPRGANTTPSPETISSPLYRGQDLIRKIMDDTLYAPRTTPGKYAKTVGEFIAPGGIPSKAALSAPTIGRKIGEYGADITRTAVAPGILSEGAGQLAEGSQYETAARIGGAVLGVAGGAAAKTMNAPETVLRRSTGPADKINWGRAIELQNNPTGVKLTGPEAIAQAQEGASALPNLQRVVEGSLEGRAATAPFFAQRPAQMDAAVGNMLDTIAPQSLTPSVLGPRAAENAASAIDDVRQGINTQTRPLYQESRAAIIPENEFAAVASDPRFQASLERLRANRELAPDYAGLPDNSIGVMDAVAKDLFARGESLSTRTNPLYGPELAGKSSSAGADVRGLARDPNRGGSAAYDEALKAQTALRRDVLQPVEQGPLGQIASSTDTTSAGNALLPKNPLVGSQAETADAVGRLVAADPTNTAQLVRQNLADRYSAASTATQEGARDFAGAKFNKDVAGNAQRKLTLEAVIMGVDPSGAAKGSMNTLLDVLEATGRRKPIGSATEFNRSVNIDLGTASPMGRGVRAARTAGASALTTMGDTITRATARRSVGKLADLFTDPQSVELIREAIARGAPSVLPEAAAQSAFLSAIIGTQERKPFEFTTEYSVKRGPR